MVFSLVPESALAQVWISSGFQPAPAGPNGQQNVTATCSTSAVNPATGQTSPTAGDYEGFVASCDVTTSTTPAQTITFPQCPYWGWGSYNGLPGDYGNPGNVLTPSLSSPELLTPSMPSTMLSSMQNLQHIQVNVPPFPPLWPIGALTIRRGMSSRDYSTS